MSSTCPKCHHVRRPDETAPAWQCPACGVAYAKAADAARPQEAARSTHVYRAAPASGMPWGKVMLAAALVVASLLLWQFKHGHADDAPSLIERLGGGGSMSSEQMQALAATVKAHEVVMYSTTECIYCGQAKGWLNQNGFAFTECNMSVSSQCESEFKSFGANGTPYLVVRGHHMKDGFDSEQFLSLLKL